MDLDGQLMQEQFHSTLVGRISNDFDVNEFEREEEQEEEDRIGDVVSSDSDDSNDDQGGRDDMPTSVDAMLVPVHAMPLPVPTEVLHAMLAQGILVTDLPEDDTPMIHGVELAKHSSTFHHRAYATEFDECTFQWHFEL
jgi:hypothetical protein